MFEVIKKMFGGASAQTDEVSDEAEARECAIALLVEAALSDGIYADIEQDMIKNIIRESFSMDDAAAASLLEAAELRAEMAVDQYAFTHVIKKYMPKSERVALIGQLWDVTYADGEESPFEDSLIRRVAALLAVTDHERAEAKKASLGRREGS
ncbi:MAG: hypothetical protein COA85_02630 [Robiginitomaculum sp.]|nr:MAG: hypothetical protein COA85_02630 [Robiginitomaculum sp.]